MALPVRKIIDFPRDKDGLFIQPDELTQEVAVIIEKNRERMFKKWMYSDEHGTGDGKTLDPNGNYDCVSCNQADGEECLALYDDSGEDADEEPPLIIDLAYGGCGVYEVICAGDPELRAYRLPASVANYGVRAGGSPGHVYGCKECWMHKVTKWPDSRNRPFWCGAGGSTVTNISCCIINGAPTIDIANRAAKRGRRRRVHEWVMQASQIKVAKR